MYCCICNLKKRRERERPYGNAIVIKDERMRMRVPIGDEEVNDDVDEESKLTSNVKEEQILWQTSEETEFQRGEKGGVNCPY